MNAFIASGCFISCTARNNSEFNQIVRRVGAVGGCCAGRRERLQRNVSPHHRSANKLNRVRLVTYMCLAKCNYPKLKRIQRSPGQLHSPAVIIIVIRNT